MANPARLLELQKLDTTWEKIRRRLLQIQKLTADPEELLAQRQQLAQTEAALHKWRAAQRNAELESQSLRERIHASEQKLMSGAVRIPKELEALQHSVESLRRQQAASEEAGVEALLEVEQGSSTHAVQAKALAAADADWKARLGDLHIEEAKLKRHAVQIKGQRVTVVAALQPAEASIYEDLRKRKAGVAVAEISNGLCSACSVRIPTGTVSVAKAGVELAYCQSCGRILVAA